jgi:antitoxin VapB
MEAGIMPAATSKTFRSGNSQALRLPRELAYDDGADLTLFRLGEVLTAVPRRPRSNADIARALLELPGPGEVEVRDSDVVPERPGL